MSVGSGTTQSGGGAAAGVGRNTRSQHSARCRVVAVVTQLPSFPLKACGLAQHTTPAPLRMEPADTEDLTPCDSDTSATSRRWCLDILAALDKPRLPSPSSLAFHYPSPSFLPVIECQSSLLLSPASCWRTHQSRVAFLTFLICITAPRWRLCPLIG